VKLIASGNSKRFHQLVSSTMSSRIEDFYRLFLVPGVNHCAFKTPGAYAFGQGPGIMSNKINDTKHNLLLAMVDWVEGGNAPASIIGADDDLEERRHCLYPQRSVWSDTEWICVDAPTHRE
jgi:hypothetical protein